MTQIENDLAYTATRYHRAVEELAVERAHLMQLAQEAAEDGVSEYRIAALCAVERSTVRRWLGK